ncbi:dethiobiotin synthase [Rhodococcus chondri]|uniref:ATP-dependent dethiobiotin synthetase BioD n=1 Tax=Rhodococcus chondri TaxID=3065941 RepID=A0ABU7JWK5_9NOCA|nr:dethiobiotin synthase [Rhodococcus sp. CC-R104]MEE2034399.1 dethiobiotin synthase [Rhodococcus sp. CC-R104]
MSVVCVTGTSTGVGKTVVTAALATIADAAGMRVAVCKPAQTGVADGEPGDLDEVRRLAGPRIAVFELARYPEPLAPDTAARRADLPLLRFDEVVAALEEIDARHDLTLVEGAGGVLVRLGEDGFTLVDVAVSAAAPAVVVAGAALGTLNHTALTVAALRAARVPCAGTVIGSWPQDPGLAEQCKLEDLPDVTGVPLLGVLTAGSGGLGAAEFSARVRQCLEGAPESLPVLARI